MAGGPELRAPSMNDLWTITLLGGLRATQGERVITRFRSQRTAALLTYLAHFASGRTGTPFKEYVRDS